MRQSIKKLNGVETAPGQARGGDACRITARGGVSDVSVNREKFQDKLISKAKRSLDTW